MIRLFMEGKDVVYIIWLTCNNL